MTDYKNACARVVLKDGDKYYVVMSWTNLGVEKRRIYGMKDGKPWVRGYRAGQKFYLTEDEIYLLDHPVELKKQK